MIFEIYTLYNLRSNLSRPLYWRHNRNTSDNRPGASGTRKWEVVHIKLGPSISIFS